MAVHLWAGAIGATCIAAAVGAVIAYRSQQRTLEIAAKMTASTAFVALWWFRGAPPSRWLLAALACCWIGDLCLLARSQRAFLAGLAVFGLAHGCYAGIFATQPHAGMPIWLGCGAALIGAGGVVVRMLWPRLEPSLRVPVVAYMAVLAAMCTLAVSASHANARWAWGAGAILFAASDIAIALHRFVDSSGVHRMWGLPLYYLAQIILALTGP